MPRYARLKAEVFYVLTVPIDLASLGVVGTVLFAKALGFKYRVYGYNMYTKVPGAGAGAVRTIVISRWQGGSSANASNIASFSPTVGGTASVGAPIAPVNFTMPEMEDADMLRVSAGSGGIAFTGGQVTLHLLCATMPQVRNA